VDDNYTVLSLSYLVSYLVIGCFCCTNRLEVEEDLFGNTVGESLIEMTRLLLCRGLLCGLFQLQAALDARLGDDMFHRIWKKIFELTRIAIFMYGMYVCYVYRIPACRIQPTPRRRDLPPGQQES
jgi:hypothetical protein